MKSHLSEKHCLYLVHDMSGVIVMQQPHCPSLPANTQSSCRAQLRPQCCREMRQWSLPDSAHRREAKGGRSTKVHISCVLTEILITKDPGLF